MRFLFTLLFVAGILFAAAPQYAGAQVNADLLEMLKSINVPDEVEEEEVEYREITEEDVLKMMQDQQQAEREVLPGENKGWPGADILGKFNITSVKQPAGSEAAYDGGDFSITIYLKCDNPDAVVQDLAKQVEAATKSKKEAYDYETNDIRGNTITTKLYKMIVYIDKNKMSYRTYDVMHENGFVVISVTSSAA